MMGFFGAFHSRGVTFMPSVEYTFELYKNLLLAMVLVFQLPTLAFFLAKMRLVTARFLWRRINYAILAIFIVAAVLTPSPDPWNQAIFAVPMIALYLISIGIAWIVGPKRDPETLGRRRVGRPSPRHRRDGHGPGDEASSDGSPAGVTAS